MWIGSKASFAWGCISVSSMCVFAQREGVLEAVPAAAITSAMTALSFSSPVVELVATAALKRKSFTLRLDAVGGVLEHIGMSSAGAERVVTYLQWVRPGMASLPSRVALFASLYFGCGFCVSHAGVIVP